MAIHGRLIVAAAFLLLVPAVAYAQEDWKAELAAEQVSEADDTYTYEESGLLELRVPGYESARVQVKVTSTAPADGPISRDNFVATTRSILNGIVLTAFAEGYDVTAAAFLQSVDYRELTAPIGEPDNEINIRMTPEGVQYEIVETATQTTQRTTLTWGEFYGE